jgi:hypothetical protein
MIEWHGHTIVEHDAMLREAQRCFQCINLSLAHLL